MPEPGHRLPKALRLVLIVAAILAITYPAASGLIVALSRHGQPDPAPRPWPWKQMDGNKN